MSVHTKLLAALCAAVLATPIPVVMAATEQVTTAVRVHSGPGNHYRVLENLKSGASVDVSKCRAHWCRIDVNGKVGWINTNSLPAGIAERMKSKAATQPAAKAMAPTTSKAPAAPSGGTMAAPSKGY